MKMMKGAIAALTLVLSFVQCGSDVQETPFQNPEVAAPDVDQSFVAVDNPYFESGDPDRPGDRQLLGITDLAFEKEYIMHGSMIPQAPAATSSGLAARIVAFRKYGGSVFMLQATEGHVVTDDLPSSLILAEFKVVGKKKGITVVDFNRGMNRLYLQNWIHTTDYPNRENWAEKPFRALKIKQSFVDTVKLAKPYVEIRQIAQVEMPDKDPRGRPVYNYPSFEAKYYIAPYRPNPKFEPKKTSDFKWVGFFEAAPIIEKQSGRKIVHIGKWDTSKVTDYYISANTPAAYVDAVREGILYWNKVYGREIVRAKMAPKGVTAPDPLHNVAQWVPWDRAGFAYADALIDPRTGEIMHSQIYMTSVFAFASKRRARALIRALREGKEMGHMHVGSKALPSSRLCHFELSDTLIDGLERVLDSEMEHEAILRVSQAYVRLVAAHEIGHVLGLRHNFAGNLESNLSPEQRDRLWAEYVVNNVVPGDNIKFSSSVMEYMSFEDDVMSGAQMLHQKHGFRYDETALAWGYKGKPIDKKRAPLFCTDSTVMKRLDCRYSDTGSQPLVSRHVEIDRIVRMEPARMVEAFLYAKAPEFEEQRKPLSEVALDPKPVITRVYAALASQLKWLEKKQRSLTIERQFPFLSDLNSKEVEAKRFNWAANQVAAAGGVDEVFFSLLPRKENEARALATEMKDVLENYLKRPDVLKGVSVAGKPYELTKEDVELIKARMGVYFEYVEREIQKKALLSLSKAKWQEERTAREAEPLLGEVASRIVNDLETEVAEGKPTKFANDLESRKLAVSLLSPANGELVDWAYDQRKAVKAGLIKIVEKTVGKKMKELKTDELSRELRQWVMEQKSLLGKL